MYIHTHKDHVVELPGFIIAGIYRSPKVTVRQLYQASAELHSSKLHSSKGRKTLTQAVLVSPPNHAGVHVYTYWYMYVQVSLFSPFSFQSCSYSCISI